MPYNFVMNSLNHITTTIESKMTMMNQSLSLRSSLCLRSSLYLRSLLAIFIACSCITIVADPPEIILQTGGVIRENDDGEIVDIDLSDRTLSEPLITALTKLPKLSVLRLRRTSISDEQLGQFITLKLRMIDLRNTNITDDGLVHLAKMKSLIDIQLEKSKVTDIGIQQLAGLSLKSFNANYCTSISNRSLAVLAAMPSMEQIQLDYTKINDTGMAVLATASKLTRLRIRGVDVTGAGLALSLIHISEPTRPY